MIEAAGLVKRYGSTVAVDGLSFEVRPGQVTGFLGPNGSGKSTTMRMILGLNRPDAGTVRINGRCYRDLPWPLREVGGVLDAGAFHPGRSPYNHLRALAQTNDIPKARVAEVLEHVGLSSAAHRRAGKLSLGMAQRLGMATALLGDPAVLVLDEPVNGLDPEGIRWVRNLLKRLACEGRTVFVSSHLLAEMALIADHLVVIGRGRLIADMGMSEFLQRSSGQFVRVRTGRPASLSRALEAAGAQVVDEPAGSLAVAGLSGAEIGEVALRCGAPIAELSPQLASLEDVFMELTDDSVEFRGHGIAAEPDAPIGVPRRLERAGRGGQ